MIDSTDQLVCVEFACPIQQSHRLEDRLQQLDPTQSRYLYADSYAGFSIYSLAMTSEYASYIRLSDALLSNTMRQA